MGAVTDPTLVRDLGSLVDEDCFADALLQGSDGAVAVHLAMLHVRCPSIVQNSKASDKENDMENDMENDKREAKVVIHLEGNTQSTLRNLAFFLYTDNLAEDLACTEAMYLLVLAKGLAAGRTEESLPVRRLIALCAEVVNAKVDLSNAVEILVLALSHEFSVIEQSVYDLLARVTVKDVAFCARLVDKMIPEHKASLQYAIAAMCGNANPRSMKTQAGESTASQVPQSSLLADLRVLQTCARTTQWTGSRKDLVDCGIVREGDVPCCAHRFMLAVRSKLFAKALGSSMQEGESGLVCLSDIRPLPSRKALELLLSFIYTATLEVEGAEQVDYLDLLSILGEDYLELSGYESLHSMVKLRVSSDTTSNPWNLLRRAIAAGNKAVQATAKQRVLGEWYRHRKDPEAQQEACMTPTDEECPWWTSDDEVKMVKTVFIASSCIQSCQQVEWTLTVEKGIKESGHYFTGVEGSNFTVKNSTNVHLKQTSPRSPRAKRTCSMTRAEEGGAIQATFEETVYVKCITVAPVLEIDQAKKLLQRAVLQVRSETGDWETIYATLKGDEEQIVVQRVGREWRLFGNGIATSLFIFES